MARSHDLARSHSLAETMHLTAPSQLGIARAYSNSGTLQFKNFFGGMYK